MSANEFLTRVNLMQARLDDYETPLPEIAGKQRHRHRRRQHRHGRGAHRQTAGRHRHHRLSPHQSRDAGAGRGTAPRAGRRHRAQGAARAARVRRRRQDPLRHATPSSTSWSSARPTPRAAAAPVATGKTETMQVDLVIMALGNTPNPIIKDSEPSLKTTKWGTIDVNKRLAADLARRRLFRRRRHARRLDGHPCGRRRPGGGREIVGDITVHARPRSRSMVESAARYTDLGAGARRPSSRRSSWPAASSNSP